MAPSMWYMIMIMTFFVLLALTPLNFFCASPPMLNVLVTTKKLKYNWMW